MRTGEPGLKGTGSSARMVIKVFLFFKFMPISTHGRP